MGARTQSLTSLSTLATSDVRPLPTVSVDQPPFVDSLWVPRSLFWCVAGNAAESEEEGEEEEEDQLRGGATGLSQSAEAEDAEEDEESYYDSDLEDTTG